MSASDDPDVICAALDFVEDDSDLPWAKGAARHAHWRVRMSGARALGRVGGRNELGALLELLRDPVWWVRYHAAQALTKLHGLEPHELETIRREARDAYAADMLGPPSVLLVPPATPITRDAPAYARLDLHGHGAFDFYAACRTGAGQKPVPNAATLPVKRGASVGWM